MTLVSKDIQKAAELLNQGELVAIPTETVYGLAGNIFNKEAILKIYKLKQRPLFNPLIVHIKSAFELSNYVSYIPPVSQLLADAFWPGELTMVLKKQEHIPDWVTSGKDTVACRVPNHPLSLELLEYINFPLAAPSANPFGSISPTSVQHVLRYFQSSLKMVLDGGESRKGIESTIIGFEHDKPIIYRLGALSLEDIEKITGPVAIKNKNENTPEAPGMLAKHYSPVTPMHMAINIAEYIKNLPDLKIGVLAFQTRTDSPKIIHQEILSPSGNLHEAAAKLYAALHTLDSLHLDLIITERFPDKSLGKSINDRLGRACTSFD